MARADVAIRKTLIIEGSDQYTNDPADPGGPTKYGISLRFLRSLGPLVGDLDGDGDVDEFDIKALTEPAAIQLYVERFWLPEYGHLPQRMADKVFDTAVNMGATAAHKILQEALRELGFENIVVDGRIGSMTMAAVNRAQDLLKMNPAIYQEYAAAQSFRYTVIADLNPKHKKHIRGWLRRAAKY
jgi:lysozyme family protein